MFSHVLIAAAPEARRTAMLDAIHRAHFEEGADIGDREVLLNIAAGAGFDRAGIAAKLDDPALRDEVAERAAGAREMGISGVPFFIFNGALAVSGAQPPDVLLSALEQAAQLAPVSS